MARISRSLGAGALALVTASALAAPAHAQSGSANHDGYRSVTLVFTQAADRTLARHDVAVRYASPSGRVVRQANGLGLSGTVAFDGDRTVRWSYFRIEWRRNKVSAVVNGNARKDVLSFGDGCFGDADGDRRTSGDHRRSTLLWLTSEGAAAIDYAAASDAFDRGDAFARVNK